MWALAAFLLFAQADYTTEGMKALDDGKYDSAVHAFRKAIDADSKDYFAHFNLAIALYAKSAGAQLGMAETLVQEGRCSDADVYFHQAAKLEPKYRDYLLELAGLYEKASQNFDER